MSGEELKNKLIALHISQSEVARRLRISQPQFNQALKSSDIKTGLLERICVAFNLSMSQFYPDAIFNGGQTSNNYHARNQSNGSGDIYEGISTDTIHKLIESNTKKDEQIDKLINLLSQKS